MPNGGLAAVSVSSGGLTFDPKMIHVTGIDGVNGFTVLASVIDNNGGKVSFAAVNPSSGVTNGPIARLSFTLPQLLDRTHTTVQIDPAKVVLGDVNNQVIQTGRVNIAGATIGPEVH